MTARLLVVALLVPVAAGAAPSGAELYTQQCSSCHQANAAGLAGQYPPLRNRVDKIASTPEGRHYLADLLTHGMAGAIQVGGDTYVGYMPAFSHLKDDEIVAVLDWVSALGDSKPPVTIAEADIAAARGRTLTAAGVAQERKALDAQHPLP